MGKTAVFRRGKTLASLSVKSLAIGLLFLCSFVIIAPPEQAKAAAGINEQINFQGRLFNAQGATVPDGYYNVQFKIYCDGDGIVGNGSATDPGSCNGDVDDEHLLWTETYLNNNSQGVQVKNGFLSVQLGSLNAFAGSVNWNWDELHLSMNVGNANLTCTPFSNCAPDGEMSPMKRMSAQAYALNAKNANTLGGISSAGFIQNGTSPQTADFNITGTGEADILQATTNLYTPDLDIAAAGTLAIGNANATTINVGTNAAAHIIAVGTGAGDNDITIGSTNTTSSLLLRAGTGNLQIQTQGGTLGIADNAVAQTVVIGNTTGATSVAINAGSGGITATGSTDFVNSIATRLGANFSTTGQSDDVNLGNVSLVRLTGGSAQTITGIANGRDGYLLTLLNAAGQAATIGHQHAGSLTAANRIITSTGADYSLGPNTAVTLIYDSTTQRWRMVSAASAASVTASVDLQTTTPGTPQTGHFNITGTGIAGILQAGTNVYSPDIDTAAAGTLTIGGANATTVNIANNAAAHTVNIATGAAVQTIVVGSTNSTSALTLQAGTGNLLIQTQGGTLGIGTNAIAQTIQMGNTTGATSVTIDAGSGGISLGAANIANTIQIGSTTLSSGTQVINIGNNNTAGGTTNVTIGAGTTATAGTTAIQSKGNTTISTDGVVRATFDTAGGLYLGNGVTAAAPANFTVSGSGSTTTAVAGGTITIQGGNATVGTANGGNVILAGGAGVGSGVTGLVVLNTPSFLTSTAQNFTADAAITQANVDSRSAILVTANQAGWTATLNDPTITTAGKILYVTNSGGFDMTLSVNGGGPGNLIALKPNTSATMIWNGVDWTAAGASSSTDLQSAYNNTLTSAGGAELVLNPIGGNADGLTIRNNATTPIIGAILEAQTSVGSNLFSVNNNATEYATNGGAETVGSGGAATFPANTWDTTTGGTVDRYTTAGDNVATGQASVRVQTTTTNHGARNRIATSLTSSLEYTASIAVRSATNFKTLQILYSPDGTTSGTTQCATAQTVTEGQWTRITCNFVAGGSITSSNSILIRQTDSTARTFYLDNLSINVNASATYVADGSVDLALGSNWTAFGSLDALTRDTSIIYDTSGSVNVDAPNSADRGVRNNLGITPAPSTQYLVTFFARSSNSFTDIRVRYSRDGGTNFVSCVDYNTQTVSITSFTEITCLFTTDGTTPTNPDLIIDQPTGSDRNFWVDAVSVTLNTNRANNIQIGGANKGGPTTLFTLDRSNVAPIAANNEAYLGSMYYDTATGRIQCYEADGWGACGAQPDNIVNLNPEYSGAVLNGSGTGTMTADFCSDDTALTVNASLCATGEAKNFYRWTSPQASQQTYSIYVTYQLPSTFKGFASDDTVQLTARASNTTNAAVTYEMFKSTGTAVTKCGTSETTVVTTANTWQTVGINGNEATGCAFTSTSAGNFVIFKINVKANSAASAYVGTLSFTTTGR